VPAIHISALLEPYFKKEILIYNEIIGFVNRNYRTSEEYNLVQEADYRKKQFWLAIILSIVSLLGTAIINYITFTKDRNVMITNQNAFRDTIKIEVIAPKDTVKTVKKHK